MITFHPDLTEEQITDKQVEICNMFSINPVYANMPLKDIISAQLLWQEYIDLTVADFLLNFKQESLCTKYYLTIFTILHAKLK